LAIIGCGWYGGRSLESFARSAGVEIISLCDVNANSIKTTLELVARYQKTVPKTFVDYREMLGSTSHDIVIVATPNHWHALPAIAAMKSGADVYLEKPVSHDVIEGEALVAAARKYDRVVQVNTQRRSTPHFAEARDKYVRSGKLGAIGLVETYSYLPARIAEVVSDSAPPPNLNYELWTGPAPMTPFKAIKENKGWRAFKDYGNGLTGDLGVHMFDITRWMLGLGWPSSIRSTGGIYVDKISSADISDTQRSVFAYPGFDVSWEHRTWGVSPIPHRHWTDQWGVRLVGKKGSLNLTLLGYEFTPADGSTREGVNLLSKSGNLENVDLNSKFDILEEAETRHPLDFMRARETRSRPVADIEEGHISSACCELADIALQVGRTVVYDPKTRTILNDAEATRLLEKPYRAPWIHPTPANV
jgi:predicted dehydrogenase